MGYLFTLLYLVILFVRPQEYMESIKGWPILDFLAAFSVGAVFLEGDFTSDKLKRSALNALVVCFWLSLALSWLPHMYLGGMWFTLKDFAKVVIVYFLIVLTVDTWPKLRTLLWVLVCMSTFLSFQAIWQFYTGEGLVGGEALERGTGSDVVGEEKILQARGIGIYGDPNDLAINIVPMVAFVLPAFHRGALSRTWITGLLFLVPMATGIAYTRSRGGVLGLAMVGWMYMRRRLGNVLSIGGLVVLMSMLMAIPRMEQLSAQEGTARSRLDHWAYGLSLFKTNPLFGVGYRNFTEEYSHTAHNSFVLVFAETGYLGALFWVAMLYCSFRHTSLLRKLDRAPPWLDPVVNGLEAALAGWLVCAFFLSQTYKFTYFILMAAVVATLNVLAHEGIEVHHPFKFKQVVIAAMVTVLGILVMHLGVRFLVT